MNIFLILRRSSRRINGCPRKTEKGLYTMEEILGTITCQSRHIPTDLLSKEEYLEGESE